MRKLSPGTWDWDWDSPRHAFRFVNSVVFLVGRHNLRSQRAVEKIGGFAWEPDPMAVAGRVWSTASRLRHSRRASADLPNRWKKS